MAQAKILIISAEYIKTNPQEKERIVPESLLRKIETDLRAKTGLRSIRFDEHGELTYDKTEKAQTGSNKLRQAITGAIKDEQNIFEIGDYSGSKDIQFAVTDAGTRDIDTKVTTYRVKIDFADLRRCRVYTPEEVLRSYTLGIILFHELDHKVSYDPSDPLPPGRVRPDKSSNGVRGVIENTNLVRQELSLLLRNSTRHNGEIYRGRVDSYRNTCQIVFRNESGGQKNLRWKL